MTCIVGLVDSKTKTVLIGADSQGTGGFTISNRKDGKVFKNGDFVMGCTSSYRMIQLLRFSLKPPHLQDKEIYEYMCTDFIDAVRKCFTDGGFMQKWTDGDQKGGTFLVAHKDRLFKIENDFQVGELVEGYDSCGCGEEFALGSLYATKRVDKELEPKERVLHALYAAAHFSAGVGSPFTVMSTDSKINLVEK